MLRKRYTVEVVVDLPAKGYKLEDYLKVGTNSIVAQKSFKILKVEEFEELLPHEQRRGEKKAVRETILELLKKHRLQLLVTTNQDWGDSIRLYVRASTAAERAYYDRIGHGTCASEYEKRRQCKICSKRFTSLNFYIENGVINERTYNSSYKPKDTSVGTISDPNMTQFMAYLSEKFSWCKKP